MENLSFVLWILGFPLLGSLSKYLKAMAKIKRNDYTEDKNPDYVWGVWFYIVWFGVGYLLGKPIL